MGTTVDRGRRRMAGLVGLAALVLGLATGVALMLRDDTSTTPTLPDGTDRAIALDPVPTESITVANLSVATVARHGDQVLIVDGTATADGLDPWDPEAEPMTRAWVVDADDPTEARPFDLPSVGPRLNPRAWWWDGQWAILGERCPEPWDPALVLDPDEVAVGEVTLPETCGSYTADIFRFDPSTHTVQTIATGFEGTPPSGGLETLEPKASTGDRTLFVWSPARTWMLLDLDGTITQVDGPRNGANIVPAGDTFVAISPDGDGDNQGPLVPAETFWRLQRFDGTAWVEEDLPASGYERRESAGGGVGDGFVATFGHQERYSINEPRPDVDDVLLLYVDEQSGAVRWELAPLTDEWQTIEALRTFDGEVVLISERDENARRWDGDSWVPVVNNQDPAAVYVDGFTAAISLDFQGNEWWGERQVALTRTS